MPDPALLVSLLAQELYHAAGLGTPPPMVARLRERMQSPQVGDIVVEVSGEPGTVDPDSVGSPGRCRG